MFKKIKHSICILAAMVAISCCFNGTAFVAKADEPITQEYSEGIGDISADNSASEEIYEESNSVVQNENESVDSEETPSITLDTFLDILQKEADKAGVGEEWKETFSNLQYAVKEKKFDALFWWTIAQTVLIAIYVIYKVASNVSIAKLKIAIMKLNDTLEGMTDSENQLIDEAKTVEQDEKEIKERQIMQAKAMEYTNEALREMVNGINFHPDIKKSAIRKLNKANKYLDEGSNDDTSTQ